jgi:hypothetical protein
LQDLLFGHNSSCKWLAKAKQKIDRPNLRYFFSKQSFG